MSLNIKYSKSYIKRIDLTYGFKNYFENLRQKFFSGSNIFKQFFKVIIFLK